jgi:hypothetical protein
MKAAQTEVSYGRLSAMTANLIMSQELSDYYKIPENLLAKVAVLPRSGDMGFFQFGSKATCYGQSASGVSPRVENSCSYDAARSASIVGSAILLPFDPTRVIDNLRREVYVGSLTPARERLLTQEWMLKAYYGIRRVLPVGIRQHMQRAYFSDWKQRPFPAWPVDVGVDSIHEQLLLLSMKATCAKRIPFIWFWPAASPNCLILTHDVETAAGRDFTAQLIDLDDSYGFKASFQVIPEKRYKVPDHYVQAIRSRGCEFNIHDLNHDGHLYREREEFLRRAKLINEYGRRYHARGFRAGSMYRRIDWYDAYEFSYDMSLCNVAHLEPKRGGCCTVMPFFIGQIVELPLTTSQDYSVFHILNNRSIDLWKEQINLIRAKNGLMSFLTHPDYLISRRTRSVYESLLDHLRQIVLEDKTWVALPGELDEWWRARSRMKLVNKGGDWVVEGFGCERASIAYAVLDGDCLVYEVPITEHRPQLNQKHQFCASDKPVGMQDSELQN